MNVTNFVFLLHIGKCAFPTIQFQHGETLQFSRLVAIIFASVAQMTNKLSYKDMDT